ncbi:MAG: DUF4332 domain-containing protein [Verrucomicrobiae bacterium]|nr:DUF4332 domain-containing protein [Verrucomicrobiae bacterium]
MPGLGLIKGISDDAAELLEAAGVEKPLDLAAQDVAALYPHLQTASRAMKRPDLLPERSEIDQWITAARELVETISPGTLSRNGITAPPSQGKTPRYRSDVGATARIERPKGGSPAKSTPSAQAPNQAEDADDEELVVAIPVDDDDEDYDAIPAVTLDDADLYEDDDDFDLDDDTIAAATAGAASPVKTLLPSSRISDFNKDAETLAHLEKLRARREVDMGFGSPQIKEADDVWKEVDKTAFATFNDYQDGKIAVQPLVRDSPDDEAEAKPVQRVMSQKPQEEQKISRLVRRGINYPHPVMAYCAALFVLFFRFYMIVMIIGLPIALIQLGDTFNEYWIPTAIVIGVFLLLGIVNLIIISKVRCRVCSCPMFLSQRCFKNKKAHLINGIGYVASLALHMVIFQWFRCMYCGTAIRVRGAAKTTRMEVLDAKALDIHDDDDDDPIKAF